MTPTPRLEKQLCFALHSASLAMDALYRVHLAELGLTYPQYLVMLVLWERDGRTVSELGELLFTDSATLTPLLRRLEASGVLRRTRDTIDQRVVRITLTPEGQELGTLAQRVSADVECAVEPEFTHDRIAALRTDLAALRAQLLQSAELAKASRLPRT